MVLGGTSGEKGDSGLGVNADSKSMMLGESVVEEYPLHVLHESSLRLVSVQAQPFFGTEACLEKHTGSHHSPDPLWVNSSVTQWLQIKMR